MSDGDRAAFGYDWSRRSKLCVQPQARPGRSKPSSLMLSTPSAAEKSTPSTGPALVARPEIFPRSTRIDPPSSRRQAETRAPRMGGEPVENAVQLYAAENAKQTCATEDTFTV